jgi:hypothetical protein
MGSKRHLMQEIFRNKNLPFYRFGKHLPLREIPRCNLFSSDFLRKHNLGSASSVQRAIARLLEEEVLEKTNGGYQFTDVFFKRWLRKAFV